MLQLISPILIPLFIFSFQLVYAQEERDTSEVFTVISEQPKFPGGNKAINKIINKNFTYPETAINDSLDGEVIISFIVDTLGNATNLKVKQGIREDLDNEALRIASLLNGWSPAKNSYGKQEMYMTLPITFNWNSYLLIELNKRKKKEEKERRKRHKKLKFAVPHPVY